jgi:peptidyl-prolyl cis-trans isomerase SurA
MRHWNLAAVGLAVLAAALPPMRAEESIRLDGVAAHVNGDVVTVGEALSFMEPQKRLIASRYSGADLKEALRRTYREAVKALVDRKLVLKDYENQKFKIPDALVDRRISEILNQRYDNDRGALMAALADDRMTYDEWRDKIREQLIIGVMRQENVEKHVKVSPAAVRAVYDKHQERFSKAGKMKLRMIYFEKGSTPEKREAKLLRARETMDRLRTKGGFANVAKEVSEDDKAAAGGDWGWVEPKFLQARLAEQAGGLKPGDICGPIETDAGFYILKCEERQEAETEKFDDVRAGIERDLRDDESERLFRVWTDRLEAAAYVHIKDDLPF